MDFAEGIILQCVSSLVNVPRHLGHDFLLEILVLFKAIATGPVSPVIPVSLVSTPSLVACLVSPISVIAQ